MSVPTVSIHRANDGHNSSDDQWFDAFHFTPGQDQSIRWLSRPNQRFLQEASSRDAEKFRITFDVENFQPQQIKIYIMNGQLTISGVYEERSEGRYMQKQFEKSFDIPDTAEVEAMAAYITTAHMLVVEIPLNPNQQKQAPKVDHLNVNAGGNNQRRLSFSLDKFNTLNNQSPFSTTNDNQDTLAAPPANQQIRRTSITKTTTTTTTSGSGSNGLPADLAALLGGGGDAPQPNSPTPANERRGSVAVPHQIIINEPPPSPATNNPTTSRTVLSDSDLANLAIDIPPELLAVGGTITIQKRRVSVTRTADPNHPTSPPAVANTNNTPSNSQGAKPAASSTTPVVAAAPPSSNQPSSQPKTGGSGSSTATLTSNEKKTFTLEEFLGNKTWNPSIIDNYDGKKILYMRLEIGQGITIDQFRITLSGHDLRVEMLGNAAGAKESSNEKSYRQVTLFPICDVEQLKTTLKKDGFLHIQVPIQL